MKYYELTKEQIKAIRIIKGYNPDLRIPIRATSNRILLEIMDLIEENEYYFLGFEVANEMTMLTDVQRKKIYNRFALQVIRGR